MTSTIYLNGRRYVREIKSRRDVAGAYAVYATFAYRGISAEMPAMITYTIRER